jgi:hypothetical protein
MLTNPRPRARSAAPPQSLRLEYSEFILQRIEEFKEQHSREQLMTIADEALQELDGDEAEQLVLTEVLVQEHVDRVIIKRLRLPTYKRWRDRHTRLRQAQRQPTHWGLDPDSPLVELASRLEPSDIVWVLGSGAAAAAFFLAAHDVATVLIDADPAGLDAAEHRARAEALATRFETTAVLWESTGAANFMDQWFPGVAPALVVFDVAPLSMFEAVVRARLIETLKRRCAPGGVHHVLPGEAREGVRPLAPEALQAHYAGWHVDRSARGRARGFLAIKP